MAEINVSIDTVELERKLEALQGVKNGAPRAIMRAMNRTLTGMGTDASRKASKSYVIKQKDVRANLDLKDKATMTDLSITMRSRGRPIRLAKFRTKPNKSPGRRGSPPAFAQVKRAGAGGRISGAFMANFQAGKGSHQGVFVRTGKFARVRRGANAGKVREKIRQLHGPGVVQMLDNQPVRDAIQAGATERFNKELDHQVKHLLREANK